MSDKFGHAQSVDHINTATFGVVSVTVVADREPGPVWGGVAKLQARFVLAVNGEQIGTDQYVYTYGCVRSSQTWAQSLRTSIRTAPTRTVGQRGADDLGMLGDRESVLGSLSSWEAITTQRRAILEHVDAEELDAILQVARELDEGYPFVDGRELQDAGTVPGPSHDPWLGQRWEDEENRTVYSAADVLAARLEALS